MIGAKNLQAMKQIYKNGRHCEEERGSNLTKMGYSGRIKIASSNEKLASQRTIPRSMPSPFQCFS
jgi:hypothetical protein